MKLSLPRDMVKSFIAFLLISSVLTSRLGSLSVLVGFKFNRDYISAKLCVNKDKPKLQCKGKCYLAKKLKQTEEQEKNDEKQSVKNPVQEAIIASVFRLKDRYWVYFLTSFVEKHLTSSSFPESLFQPPRV